ncbi:MAG: CbiX/SirB N-terminal domain-containing protein [Proteobacteria bacterium]|nr:CbiX/SirB N-terminal domain-containing protein [Pseudomonadota bacterium]
MKALLIVAHGSRKKESNDEIIRLSAELEKKARDTFDIVASAFIQFATPLVPEVIDQLVAKGVTELIVVPYFIAAGSHVVNDIPRLIDDARKKYNHIAISLTPHLGKFDGMKELILSGVR